MSKKLLILIFACIFRNVCSTKTSTTVDDEETEDDIILLDTESTINSEASQTLNNYTVENKINTESTYVVKYTLTDNPHYEELDETATDFAKHLKSQTTDEPEDTSWVNLAIRDIAYYLRIYKFREYDRRYSKEVPKIIGQYFAEYPKPPLRSLHWEVHKYCDESFLKCLKYLNNKVKLTVLKREDDTNYVMKELNWTTDSNAEEIEKIDSECRNYSEAEFFDATPFEGPLERFQWRTTASYYMCWYTMKEEPDLKHFNESCNNFADCFSNESSKLLND